jgi:hypothetical protein
MELAPILRKHGLVESSEEGRPTVRDVFSRLFEVETPAEIAVKARELNNDLAGRRRRVGWSRSRVPGNLLRSFSSLEPWSVSTSLEV